MSDSFKNIVKSTSVVGGVQVFSLLFGLIRNKMIALFFGSAGMGIWGLYLSFTEMIQSTSSLGLDKSSVKQISENKFDPDRLNLTLQVVIYSVTVFSLLCSIICAFFASYFSESIFGTTDYRDGILICCLVVFLNTLLSLFNSILNGLREIKKLALSQLYGILVGNIIVFALLPYLGTDQIPLFLLVIALSAVISSYIYLNKIEVKFVKISFKEISGELSGLMKVGMAFWISAMFMTLMAYLSKIFLQTELSVSIVGIYQASWTISNLYIGIILASMGVDFFPKICNAIKNEEETSKMMNEQIEFGLLVSIPFIVGIIIFAPVLLTILYSTEFAQGSSIIRWQMLGVTFRLLGFPFNYALMAKGKTIKYTLSQFLFNGINYLLLVFFVMYYGVEALGLNYCISYLILTVLLVIFCYRDLNFRFSYSLLKMFVIIGLLFTLSSLVILFTKGLVYYFFGILVIILSSFYSYRQLTIKLNFDVVDFLSKKFKK